LTKLLNEIEKMKSMCVNHISEAKDNHEETYWCGFLQGVKSTEKLFSKEDLK